MEKEAGKSSFIAKAPHHPAIHFYSQICAR